MITDLAEFIKFSLFSDALYTQILNYGLLCLPDQDNGLTMGEAGQQGVTI